MSVELVVVEVMQDGVEVSGATRESGDLVTINKNSKAFDILTRNNLVKTTKKEVASEDSPEVEVEKVPKNIEEAGQSGQNRDSKQEGPTESFKIPVSENRNLKVAIWDGKYGLSIALEEGKKNEDTREWSNNRIYLPTAKSFEVAQRIMDAGKYVRDNS